MDFLLLLLLSLDVDENEIRLLYLLFVSKSVF